jgi:hypothetical protein
MTHPRLAVLALVTCTFVAAGCGVFDTAQPDPPDANPPVPPNFNTPESTLVTMERAVETRSTSNYGLCLSDSIGLDELGFYAVPDPADLAAWLQQGNPDPGLWTRERELTFFPNFLAFDPNNFYTVTFTQDPAREDESIDANTQVLNRRYRVFAGGNPIVAGSAGLTMARVGLSGEWKLRYWEDHRDTSEVRTWGTARLSGR